MSKRLKQQCGKPGFDTPALFKNLSIGDNFTLSKGGWSLYVKDSNDTMKTICTIAGGLNGLPLPVSNIDFHVFNVNKFEES